MVMCGSSISDGNRHDPNNLPILLGGKGGGRINSGRHIASPTNTPVVQFVCRDAGVHGD